AGTHVRAGMGKLRGRAYRTPKSLLLVTADGKAPAAHNLPGVDVVAASRLSAEHLAPGGDPGRLTLYTKGAIQMIKEAYE
ncbi:MAG TPA: 50S ribosomal protein L4, partial [Candidatus Thermoplasmatota archaeon]|nr:50S ribosomal protein L4 [Candidatus Thermoplasmatota archaeon]